VLLNVVRYFFVVMWVSGGDVGGVLAVPFFRWLIIFIHRGELIGPI